MPFAVRQRSEAAVRENIGVVRTETRAEVGGWVLRPEGQRARATCNLTADCASFTSSSDIAQSRYHGNRQEQKSVADPLSPPSRVCPRFRSVVATRPTQEQRTAKVEKRNEKRTKKKKKEIRAEWQLQEIDSRGSRHGVIVIAEGTSVKFDWSTVGGFAPIEPT